MNVEQTLETFRDWLQESEQLALYPLPTEPATEPIGLHTLLGQFLALKHEVNLLTRASRTQQEQAGVALTSIQSVVGQLEQAKADLEERLDDHVTQAEVEAQRSLLKALVDVNDLLGLAQREVSRVQASLGHSLIDEEALPPVDPVLPAPAPSAVEAWRASAPSVSFWQRWFGTGPELFLSQTERLLKQQEDETLSLRQATEAYRALLAQAREEAQVRTEQTELMRKVLASVVTGYTMSQQRLDRALSASGLEKIPTVGEPFDPETMEAIEAAHNTGRSVNEVVDEVKAGYYWKGKVFRYAQVRVARS